MSSVKRDQIIQEAEKLVSRGKLDAAIKEYRRAADQAPNDTNTLNRLGDLLQRVGKVAEAIEVYQRIAEHFAADGFFLKSIAIFKKVNRLDPQRTETYERLADLYFKQGLAVEGRQQLLTLADWFLRSKQPQGAVRVYRRLVELEPGNFQARAKLVDLLVQLGDGAAVVVEIDALGQSLLSRGMLDEGIKLYHRALDLAPEQVDFVAPCVDALVAANRHSQAVELARKALATSKPGIELRRAAARAWVEAGDLRSARKLLEELLQQTGERTDILQLYGDLMLRVGESEEAKELLFPLMDRLLKAGDLGRAAALVKKLLLGSPGDPAVLERAIKVFDRKADPDMVMNLETALADAYFRGGRRDEASPLYQRLAREHPDNALFALRLSELGIGRAPAAPRAAAREAAPAAPADAAPPPDGEIEFVDVDLAPPPTVAAAAPPASRPEEEAPAAAPVEAAAALSPTNAEELYTEAMVFVKYGLTEKAIAHLHRLLALDPTHVEGREMLRSLGGGEMVEVEFEEPEAEPPAAAAPAAAPPPPPEPPAATPPAAAGIPAPAERFPEFEAPQLAAAPPPPAAPAAAPPVAPIEFWPVAGPAAAAPAAEPVAPVELPAVEPPAPPKKRRKSAAAARPPEVPALDALLEPAKPAAPRPRQPRGGARPVRLDDLEAMLGLGATGTPAPARHPAKPAAAADVEFDLAALGLRAPAAAPPVPAPVAEAKPAGEPVPAPAAPAPAAAPAIEEAATEAPLELVEVPELLEGPSDDQLRELDFLIQQGLLDDAAKLLAKVRESFGDHPDVMSRHALLKARGWDDEKAPAPSASAAELFSEEEQFFDLAAELEKELAEDELVAEATGAGKNEDVSIEELFKEFQRGVAEQVEAEDFDTHFNLGLAYREMGLLDEAIGEFQLSAKSADFLVESASMIGACYIDKGLPEQAVGWYGRALGAANVPADVQAGLRYELGRAHELAGNVAGALSSYAEVLAVYPSYRDVVDRISRLRAN
ncbi:MAG TPA: tetratricopeptide repeat protein [Thermoanaerobaculaceae bacterium]|nr:tetratricopeptide repeat protein [Thermoanaerobaculaceae bacterium]